MLFHFLARGPWTKGMLGTYSYLQLQTASGARAKHVLQPIFQHARFSIIAGGCLQGCLLLLVSVMRHRQIGSVNTHMRMRCLNAVQMHLSA